MSDRPVVIMKFGGTSVADAAGRAAVARRVLATLEAGSAPVLVVSAMGRAGAPYATDTLLGLVRELPTDERERDLLASAGETITAVVVAHELRGAGVDAQALSGPEAGVMTDGTHGSAAVLSVHTAALHALVSAGRVPVVAGFQGLAPDGSVTTLGRGGSDTTACALGTAIGAEAVEIYTDVDGVMTADPRVCGEATVLRVIGSDELFQMALHGSKVMHTPAAELALVSGLAVRVKNTFSAHPGTLVADLSRYAPVGVATAVSHTAGVARVVVRLESAEGSAEHMETQTRVYCAMADAGISLDMFTPCCSMLVFTIAEDRRSHAEAVLEGLGHQFEVTPDLAKVTLVGAGMHGVPGVMARMATCLAAADVHVLQTADSHTTISVLIPAGMVDPAVGALHEEFGLAAPEPVDDHGAMA